MLTPSIAAAPKRGGHKALRLARRKAYYGAQALCTLANKKRTLARHVRRFPDELNGCAVYAERYGGGALQGQLDKVSPKAAQRIKMKPRGVRI